jgi:hypothetical protein
MFDLEGIMGGLTPEGAAAKAAQSFLMNLENEVAEKYLETLLHLMKVTFWVNPAYRRNIENFTGLYRFRSKDGGVNVLVRFHHGKMEISEDPAPEAHVTVEFKNSEALMTLLLAFKKDILKLILNNEVLVTGNINYLYKFIFMANHPLHPLLNLANKL